MNTVIQTLQFFTASIDHVLANNYVHAFVLCVTLSIKLFILRALVRHRPNNHSIRTYFVPILLFIFLIGGCLDDLSWLIKLLRLSVAPQLSYIWVSLIIRLAWASMILGWHALALLLEHLAYPKRALTVHQKIFFITTGIFIICYGYFIVGHFHITSRFEKSPYEYELMQLSTYYCMLLLFPSLLAALSRIRSKQLPRILTQQLKTLLTYFVVPLYATEVYHAFCAQYIPLLVTPSYAFATIYTLLITASIYYCAKKLIATRFLDIYSHVHSMSNFRLFDQFKNILEQLSSVTNHEQINTLSKTFFKQTLAIEQQYTHTHLRTLTTQSKPADSIIEHFLTHKACIPIINTYLSDRRIIIFDEIEFDNSYEQNEVNTTLIAFMRSINADIFAPLYEQQTIIGALYIDRNARQNILYSDFERDTIIIFARFVAHVHTLMRNNQVDDLISQHKQLSDTLYQKHQELAHYKESVRSLIADERYKKIGVIYYKNRSFTCANQDARDLIIINPAIQPGHPLTHTLKTAVRNVQLYKTKQTMECVNDQGNRLIFTALPTLELQTVLIIVHYPDISDIIMHHNWHKKDQTTWDYGLYLETTHAGELINKALPGTSPTILSIKIKLLRYALSKKALVLNAPDQDLRPLAELLHHVSAREPFYELNLETLPTTHKLTVALFGINQLFGAQLEPPLFERLTGGTLLITNFHRMDNSTQEHLANYLKYGTYQSYKSTQQHKSDVRILCATHKDLKQLLHDNQLIPALYEQLKDEIVTIPSLLMLSEQEFNQLVDDFALQSIAHQELSNILHVSDSEKNKLIHKRPVSIYELKKSIQQLLTAKSIKNTLTVAIDQHTDLVDPLLIGAARLGKRALRDPQLMAQLWTKFKNQNKIATLLGVNRSSVNKRCREYNLT